MTAAIALAAAVGVFLATSRRRRERLVVGLGRYLEGPEPEERSTWRGAIRSAVAGIDGQVVLRRFAAALSGAAAGALLAHSGLVGDRASSVAAVTLGGVAGWLLYSMRVTTMRQQRARRLRFELPVATEAIALHVLAGESISSALRGFVTGASGVAADELGSVLDAAEAGESLVVALRAATKRSADPESGRLYGLLGHAHNSGGRLADSLTELARDYRASLAREVTAEGGRRAVATYGPVLFLMVPVTLLFLLYPTIEGLRSLAP